MSPPLLTYALTRPGAAAIAARISSATAPATAAIGVTNAGANGATAAAIARATVPPRAPGAGRRRAGSSATSSSRMVGEPPLGARIGLGPGRRVGPHDQVDRPVVQVQPPPVGQICDLRRHHRFGASARETHRRIRRRLRSTSRSERTAPSWPPSAT